MTIQFEGLTYYVDFKHCEYCPIQVIGKVLITHSTECRISQGRDATWIQLAFAQAYCSIDDQFSRRRGRSISLGRALKSLAWPQNRRKVFIAACREAELTGGKVKTA